MIEFYSRHQKRWIVLFNCPFNKLEEHITIQLRIDGVVYENVDVAGCKEAFDKVRLWEKTSK